MERRAAANKKGDIEHENQRKYSIFIGSAHTLEVAYHHGEVN